jgi:FAD:protein FMN transferase
MMNRQQLIRLLLALSLVLAFGITTYRRNSTVLTPQHQGETMGTSYSFKIGTPMKKREFEQLCTRIEETLKEVNRQMSTWDASSEISRFNALTNSQPMTVSAPFYSVIEASLALSKNSKGAFDPTLNPLLNLWGFGHASDWSDRQIPAPDRIEAVRAQTGWQKLIATNQTLRKTIPELQLDLGAIAKGYGVDQLAADLRAAGITHFFAEIGGEVVVSGLNREKNPWRIGINDPRRPFDGTPYERLHLTNGAIATSGNYFNFIEQDGRIYSHILDPRTGNAIYTDLASVTVYAPTCMEADGIATALMVMGSEEGLRWVENQPHVEALFLSRLEDGSILEKFSSGFKSKTGYTAR